MGRDIVKESLEELLKNRAALADQMAKVDLIIGLLRDQMSFRRADATEDEVGHGHV